MFYSEVRHQLQFENQPIDVDTETDAEEAAVGPQELIVKIPLVKRKKLLLLRPKALRVLVAINVVVVVIVGMVAVVLNLMVQVQVLKTMKPAMLQHQNVVVDEAKARACQQMLLLMPTLYQTSR